MASPFPGMDPFLEAPTVFPGFHRVFLVCLETALQGLLPEPYFADTGERVWIEVSQRYVEPDTGVYRKKKGKRPRSARENQGGAGGIAVATPPVVVKVAHDPHKEAFVNVFRKDQAGHVLVCSIEMLSPSNKTAGEKAQGLYLQKQQELLESNVHLIEIDFLRAGKHTTAVPRELLAAEAGRFDYHICCHRFHQPEEYLVYPIRIEDHLPVIEVPLLPADGAVRVDLQRVFNQAYEGGPYRRLLDYKKDRVTPPLRNDQEKWLIARLSKKGIARTS
jgi:hypothetical protein